MLLRGLRAVLYAGVASSAVPAYASISDEICAGSSAQLGYPADQALEDAARDIEVRLQERRALRVGATEPTASAAAGLQLASRGPRLPSDASIARYCSAAGELMRVAPDGSQRQAQMYLQTALQRSRKAALPALTALTAYRLGVVSLSGASVVGLRGGEPTRRNGGQIVRQLRAVESQENTAAEICSALADIETGGSADPSFSMLALDCAARLALEANSYDVSALASLRFARFALDWADSSDDPDELLKAARERTLAAIDVAERVPNSALRGELIGRLARTALQLGAGSDQRLSRVPRLLRAASANGSAAEIEARLALVAGDRHTAKPLIEQAILSESARPLPVQLPQLFLLLADAEPERRQEHVAAGYSTLENIRPALPRLDPLTEESMFGLHMRRVFESAAEAQMATAGNHSSAHILRAQQIVEAFREAELQSAVGSECLPVRSPVTPADLTDGEVLLYPLLFDDRVELIYVAGTSGAGEPQFRRLPPNRSVGRRDVAKLVDTMTVELIRGSGDRWKEPARRLYELVIQPVEAHLAPNSILTVIPDGPLRGTPFAALLSADGRYLVERTAVAVAPALAYSQPGAERRQQDARIVAASLARQVALPAGTFAALSGTEAEARIAASNGNPGTFVENFTRQELVTALSAGDVDILHLATHAAFNGRSDRAFIVANGELIRLSELRDILAENRARGDLLDLLILSACETAVGDDEASMGLAGAAVQAGAMSAMASLWQVDDTGTAELMRQFYTNYRNGQSKAESLRKAQLALIRGGGDNADPFVWSAFTLLGAWR